MMNKAAVRLHGDERLIYGIVPGFCEAVVGHIGNCNAEAIGYEKRIDFLDCKAEFRIAMKSGQRRVLPESPERRLLDLIEMAKAHFRNRVEHLFRIIKCQFRFRKVFYRVILKNGLMSSRIISTKQVLRT
jgi:transposase, IS5 family